MNNIDKTWDELAQEKIKARRELNQLPPGIAQNQANILQAQLWQPDWENHQLPGSFWNFEDDDES